MELIKKLIAIQTELNAPKNQENKFGGYKYRSLEDITEAMKPLQKTYAVAFLLEDHIEQRGTPFVCRDVVDMGHEDSNGNWVPDIREIETVKGARYFTVATATLIDETGEKISCVAEAEHPENKKGMDAAQVSGATSSYARKYAACGLLAIDDNRDPDATNDHGRASIPEIRGREGARNGTRQPTRTMTPPKQEQSRHDVTERQKAPKQNTPPPAKAPEQNAPEKSPAEKQLEFMARLGVSKEDMETVLAKPFEKFAENDFAFIREVVKLMRNQKISFEDAVQQQCVIEQDTPQEGAQA